MIEQKTAMRASLSLLIEIVNKGGELISSLLFPPRCPVCDEILLPEEVEHGIHFKCEKKLYPVIGAVCMHCGRPLGEVDVEQDSACAKRQKDCLEVNAFREYCYECQNKGYVPRSIEAKSAETPFKNAKFKTDISQGKALYLYRGAIKTTMYRFKYSNKREYAKFFAKQAEGKYGQWLLANGIQVIVPVPMFRPKQQKRGYNQAESFAKELSRITGIPIDTNLIKRTKDTTPQKELNDKERKNNLENAFQKGKSIVQYSHVLVVDDIYTTGSTAQAVANELKKTGIRHVYFMSICIGGDR